MTTQISTKFAALTAALVMNALMIGSVAFLFNGQLQHASFSHMAHAVTKTFARVKV